MSGITTHVLDTARGRPAADLTVILSTQGPRGWAELARTATDAAGRIANMVPAATPLVRGTVCRLRFEVGDWFAAQGLPAFYPFVEITFSVQDDGHHHVPLLLSPFGYSTYRGG
jgi:5-hydroxyisourate hydrolase